MIVLFTDFGASDIYVAQVKARLFEHFPAARLLDLLHDAPSFRIQAGAHLLDALQAQFPAGTVFLAVVDPGVGTDRDAVVLEADDKWYVGPDNGLLSVVAARSERRRVWRITWRPPELSVSFHGRDLFAPLAAEIARGDFPESKLQPVTDLEVRFGADDLGEVIYVDHYGNALTGLRARHLAGTAKIAVGGRELQHARVFSDASSQDAFWYENSIGLVELAANRASAAALLGIGIGEAISVRP